MGDSSWSLGVLAGLPLLLLVALVAVVVLVLAIRTWLRGDDYYDGASLLAFGAGIVLLIVVGVLAVGFYPYKAEYHQWTTTSGEVTSIDSRLIGQDGKGSTERFVVTIDGVGERGCDDTRCASVEVGDVLTLACKREWQFSGTDGYGCNFVELKRA